MRGRSRGRSLHKTRYDTTNVAMKGTTGVVHWTRLLRPSNLFKYPYIIHFTDDLSQKVRKAEKQKDVKQS